MNIYFFFPYEGVGGVSTLFLKLADRLSRKDFAVHIVDYKNGYMSLNLQNKLVEKIFYSDDEEIEIKENSLIVMQLMTPWTINQQIKFKKDTKLFFWNCHPNNLVPYIPSYKNFFEIFLNVKKTILKIFFRGYIKKLKKFLKILQLKDAVVFLDGTSIRNTEYFLDQNIITPKLLPIPVEELSDHLEFTNLKKNQLRISWIGRVEDFKTKSLEKVMNDLENYENLKNLEITFNIIGEGKDLNMIKNKSKHSSIYYNFINNLSQKELNNFLNKKTDLLFAMGTSALEGGSSLVPTVLLDVSYKNLDSEYRYKWLYETKEFSLAEIIHANFNGYGKHGFEEILFEVLINKKKHAELCNKYVIDHHNLDLISNDFLSYIKKNTLEWRDIKTSGIMNQGFLYYLKKMIYS